VESGVVNEKIAATVRVYRRQMLIGGQSYAIGGIGEVSTKAEYRGRGYAKQILAHAVKWMNEQKIPISALQTGTLSHAIACAGLLFLTSMYITIIDDQWPLYHSLGWQRATEQFTMIPASSIIAALAPRKPASPSPSLTGTNSEDEVGKMHVRPLDLRHRGTIDQVAAIHNEYTTPRYDGPFVRSSSYWQRWIPNHVYQSQPMHLPVRQ
jgi:predicted GNAT family acetyltransferase